MIEDKQKIINDNLVITIYNDSNDLIKAFKIIFQNISFEYNIDIYPNHQVKIKIPLADLNEDYNYSITDIESMEIVEKKVTIDMTTGSIKKKMVAFAVPIFLSSLLQTLYNLVDSLIVGTFLGKGALAAVSTSGNLIFLFTSFFLGASQGAGILIAKHFGARNYKEMSQIIHTNILFGLISGLFLTIVGVLFTPFILQLMNTDPAVLPKSIDYFRFYFLGCIGIVMYNVLSSTMNNVGNSRRPLYFLIISSALNVILDLLFIGVFKLGVKYAAIATTISQFVSATLCLIYLLRVKASYNVSLKRLRFNFQKLKEILRYGIPTGIQNSVIGLANVLVQSNINIFGEDAMAGYGAYIKVENFVFTPINAFTMAISTFVGQNLGAKEYERAKRGSKFGILTAMILAETFGIFLFALAPLLIGQFTKDPNVLKYGVTQSRTTSLFFFLLAFSHSVAAVTRGSGRPVIAMLVMFGVWCILRVSYIYIALSINNDIHLIYIAYPLTWTISSIIYFIYYFKSDWIHNFERKKLSVK